MLSAVLGKHGYTVVETVDGTQALEELRKPDAPKVAILDWMMPGMDGLEVVREIRTVPADDPIYVIMLTARGKKEDIILGLDAGANDYLSKPFDPGELRARLEVGRRMVELQGALLKSREELAYQAAHDPLTGVLNRRAALQRMKEEIARASRTEGVLAVCMCDLDHFKRINDTFGHVAGDTALRSCVTAIQESMREFDILGRLGGEEFLVVAHTGTVGEAEMMAERIRARVEEIALETETGAITFTISIALVLAKPDSTVDTLLETADEALYRAKETGRNRVFVK